MGRGPAWRARREDAEAFREWELGRGAIWHGWKVHTDRRRTVPVEVARSKAPPAVVDTVHAARERPPFARIGRYPFVELVGRLVVGVGNIGNIGTRTAAVVSEFLLLGAYEAGGVVRLLILTGRDAG